MRSKWLAIHFIYAGKDWWDLYDVGASVGSGWLLHEWQEVNGSEMIQVGDSILRTEAIVEMKIISEDE